MDEYVMNIATLISNLSKCFCELYGEKVDREILDKAVCSHYKVLRTRMEALLARLGGDAATAFAMRYGLNGDDPKSIAQICEQCDQSREQVRQDIEKTTTYLRRTAVAMALLAYTDIEIEDDPDVFLPLRDEIEELLDYFVAYRFDNETDLKVDIDHIEGDLYVQWSGKIGFGEWHLYTKNGNVFIDSECLDSPNDRRFSAALLKAVLAKAISDD